MQRSSKRSDLQGIRGLAILSVLGFHFNPDYFPNGYLGVDQFFVLSGFLMQMLLIQSKDKSPFSLILKFYSRRFRRILPLYLLFIFVSLTFLYNAFPSSSVESNRESASRALVFVSNRQKTGAEDYFQMLSIAIDIFTHTWSLSVEVQFYLIVPFVFLLTAQLSKNAQITVHIMIGLLSFSFHSFSPSTMAFNSVFARIWQFELGMIIYGVSLNFDKKTSLDPLETEASEEKKALLLESCTDPDLDSEDQQVPDNKDILKTVQTILKVCKYSVILSVISVLFFTRILDAQFSRPFITISTSLIILIPYQALILTNRFLTYIGDISYSLYLIHWPIFAYWKLTGESQVELFIYLLASIILSVIVYETFEKWYLQLSSTNIVVLVSFLFLANVLMINKDYLQAYYHHLISKKLTINLLDPVTNSMTMKDAERLNYLWNINDNKNLFAPTCDYENPETIPVGWCRHKVQGLTGKYKLAIFGNSWTANHATLFYEECGYKARSILQGAAYACEPLYPTKNKMGCEKNFTDFDERIREEKPDFGFILTRFVTIGEPPNFNEPEDLIYETMLNQTLKLASNIKYKLFILDAIPRLYSDKVDKIVPMLQSNISPVEIDKVLIDMEGYQIARSRYHKLIKDCGSKCQLISYLPSFYNLSSHTFRYFDPLGFSYFTSTIHLSPHGLEHVRPVWKEICKRL